MRADIVAQEYSPERVVKSKRMLLIGSMLSIVMLFAALVSAYVVTRGGADYWVNITLPTAIWVSTLLILLSSVTMYLAVKNADKGNKAGVVTYLLLTFLLGIGFAVSQFQAFSTLSERGLNFTGNFLEHLNGTYDVDYYITQKDGTKVEMINGHFIDPDDPSQTKNIDDELSQMMNPASTYLIFITGLHVLHLIGGLLYLLFLVIYARFREIDGFNYLKVRQISTYWHFVDVLWILLLFFLYFIH